MPAFKTPCAVREDAGPREVRRELGRPCDTFSFLCGAQPGRRRPRRDGAESAETTSAGTALGLFVGGLAEAQVCAMKPETTTKITKQKGEAGKPTE